MFRKMEKTQESLRLFENEWLEKLSHSHPATPFVVFAPIVILALRRGAVHTGLSFGLVLTLFGIGLFLWTLAEYGLHRFVFHYEFKSALGKRFHFIIHGNHHQTPHDLTRLVMPPLGGVLLASPFYGLFWLLVQGFEADLLFAGFISGYLVYDYTHYAVHRSKNPKFIGKFLKQSHMLHHYASPQSRWGVSSPLWDWVFGTLEAQPKENSAVSTSV
jgi:sterol desaturase/sphingolipid hydroxylase (fatty acid hydroxylase superfamily)